MPGRPGGTGWAYRFSRSSLEDQSLRRFSSRAAMARSGSTAQASQSTRMMTSSFGGQPAAKGPRPAKSLDPEQAIPLTEEELDKLKDF